MIEHLPYGEIDAEHSTGKERTTTKFASFTGQELDSAIGLLYYKSRYYDPSIGRFMSPDTVLPGKGMEPQGLNRYAYVFNNPIKYLDPTGHAPLAFNDWLNSLGPEHVASYNHRYWDWFGWKYPNKSYYQGQYNNYVQTYDPGSTTTTAEQRSRNAQTEDRDSCKILELKIHLTGGPLQGLLSGEFCGKRGRRGWL